MPDTTYKVEDIRKYIMFAKCFKPKVAIFDSKSIFRLKICPKYDFYPKLFIFPKISFFKISDEAAEALKSEYKKLRLGEGNGMQASNWRITVRQLESLIRISEALARLHCDDKVI
jgi:DNA replicative helicase MCM subunit Mcm2 (Cdc46/Mcm family)